MPRGAGHSYPRHFPKVPDLPPQIRAKCDKRKKTTKTGDQNRSPAHVSRACWLDSTVRRREAQIPVSDQLGSGPHRVPPPRGSAFSAPSGLMAERSERGDCGCYPSLEPSRR